ncbi:hypothetical protein [Pontivivens ytuae]|uniref:Uncharacterized protein n=1 Tax=Pontivivens ytuae TaxID=2789856 RepID=A0A7S9QCV1_9RHOB|nr:hypothetical protein [Pontivivens ytuae]QPH53481.1 hypothetical protein I0K15_17095 [Pontivivens ytuae]
MIRMLALAAAATIATAGSALACTPEELQEKATQAATALQTIAASDPQRATELATEMQQQAVAMQTGASMEEICAFYDTVLEEAGE